MQCFITMTFIFMALFTPKSSLVLYTILKSYKLFFWVERLPKKLNISAPNACTHTQTNKHTHRERKREREREIDHLTIWAISSTKLNWEGNVTELKMVRSFTYYLSHASLRPYSNRYIQYFYVLFKSLKNFFMLGTFRKYGSIC